MHKKGRPRKIIDTGIMFHMIKNMSPIAAVANYFGVNRDTIYANFGDIINEARQAHYAAQKIIRETWYKEFCEKERIKKNAKKKRRYRSLFTPGPRTPEGRNRCREATRRYWDKKLNRVGKNE